MGEVALPSRRGRQDWGSDRGTGCGAGRPRKALLGFLGPAEVLAARRVTPGHATYSGRNRSKSVKGNWHDFARS